MKIINEVLKDANKLVFLDFEATETSQEIISIGAVKADLDNKKQIKSHDKGFKCYIYTDTKITPIIEKMTGINNKLLKEKGISFENALQKLESYIGKDMTFTHFFTYGNYDMRLLHSMAQKENLLKNSLVLHFFSKNTDFSNLIHRYMRNEKNQTLSLANALKIFNITPVEPLHDSLSDAMNLLLLYKGFLSHKNIVKEEYLKVLTHNPHLYGPIQKVLNRLVKNKSVTLDEFYEFINEDLK